MTIKTSCGCWIRGDCNMDHSIQPCPLHAAAPKMLKALKKTHDFYSTYKLKAEHYDCGKWINEIGDILKELK